MARPTIHGEVWWANIDKQRPVVVVSRDDARGRRQRTTVVTITSTIRDIPSEVKLDEGDGLKAPSAANCDELTTIDKSRLVSRVGQLSPSRLKEVHRAIAFALALSSSSG